MERSLAFFVAARPEIDVLICDNREALLASDTAVRAVSLAVDEHDLAQAYDRVVASLADTFKAFLFRHRKQGLLMPGG